MASFQMELSRIIQIYVIQGSIGVFFLFLACKILKRNKSRLNITFSLFYIFVSSALFINFIYAPLTDEIIVKLLHNLTNFLLFFSINFLLGFTLILLKSTRVFTIKKQLIYTIIYGAFLLGMFFIPEGVTINASTDWRPVWSWTFFIYVEGIITVMAFGPSIFYSIKIYSNMKDEILKKKWRLFIMGIAGLFLIMFIILLMNVLNDPILRTSSSYVTGVLTIIFPLLVYFGVGKQIKE